MKKYELTDETLEHKGRTLHRIRALKDFGTVKKGDLGGHVESEKNLSHDGSCWICSGALVLERVVVSQDMIVCVTAEFIGSECFTGAIIVSSVELSGRLVMVQEMGMDSVRGLNSESFWPCESFWKCENSCKCESFCDNK